MSVVVGKCDIAMGVRNWELTSAVARRKQRGTNAFSLKVSDILPLARLYHLNLPKNVTNWGPNIQMSETMGNISLSNQHTTLVYSQWCLFKQFNFLV